MKIIIIEGTDNTGKNTVISSLLNEFPIVKVIHCEKPKGNTDEEYAQYQDNAFRSLIMSNIKDKHSDINAIIHNRSWYGEYVYGCMYRGNNPSEVISLIHTCETLLTIHFNPKDIVYVTLLANDPKFLVKNDDGLSISNANVDKILEETKRFEEIYEKSILPNKKIIYVNDGDKFRPKEDIMNEIKNML